MAGLALLDQRDSGTGIVASRFLNSFSISDLSAGQALSQSAVPWMSPEVLEAVAGSNSFSAGPLE